MRWPACVSGRIIGLYQRPPYPAVVIDIAERRRADLIPRIWSIAFESLLCIRSCLLEHSHIEIRPRPETVCHILVHPCLVRTAVIGEIVYRLCKVTYDNVVYVPHRSPRVIHIICIDIQDRDAQCILVVLIPESIVRCQSEIVERPDSQSLAYGMTLFDGGIVHIHPFES